ncbi:uncharacterized protein G2W53_011604 [Senna tora]|uniref:Uncharacterized protein n=1 Tax=Senna tora TaxID=362788 RepID=A0A835CDF8_9FABA|nr:uncharacterized protein G2W53_011604 [Senna tora]
MAAGAREEEKKVDGQISVRRLKWTLAPWATLMDLTQHTEASSILPITCSEVLGRIRPKSVSGNRLRDAE